MLLFEYACVNREMRALNGPGMDRSLECRSSGHELQGTANPSLRKANKSPIIRLQRCPPTLLLLVRAVLRLDLLILEGFLILVLEVASTQRGAGYARPQESHKMLE